MNSRLEHLPATGTASSELDFVLPGYEETGSLGIFHLKRVWKKSELSRAQKLDASVAKYEWLLDLMMYDELGLGLEPAIAAVFQCVTFAEFEHWVLATNNGFIEPSLVQRLNRNISAFFGAAHRPASAPVDEAYVFMEPAPHRHSPL